MTSSEIRDSFLKFFQSKQHQIVPSAPIVVKNDPTLMFTNAGMNQFKDMFLGISPIKYHRVADTQKCLRVSGKHNDLEEVGHDTYHHTMFEMLGNWSFGDYFKKEAIEWAWEYLTDVVKLDKERLYVTVFGGDKSENLERDTEAFDYWAKYTSHDRIIDGSKKDNFWEMGDTGPCGPCSEIHIDLRDQAERLKTPGRDMVNTGHPLVIEIWNNVFIQFNRKANGQLELLPAQHVDTGMGFERLCMAVQGKKSNYDTDVFQDIIAEISKLSGIKYGENEKNDIAMRVIADHLRAVSFAIADGQVPSNNKAGYVIRRILRRAVRYAYTYLKQDEPFMCKLVDVLARQMGSAFPEIIAQQKLVTQVIQEEENAFLRTLSTGIKLLDQIIEKARKSNNQEIGGKEAFELYDTFGFPLDLTELILREQFLTVNRDEFDHEMEAQKSRSRASAVVETDDWVKISDEEGEGFVGYDYNEATVYIKQYRKVSTKGATQYHLVFNTTPFYAESGGQSGDSGSISANGETITIVDTKKENNQWLHIANTLPIDPQSAFLAKVNIEKRMSIMANHTATHLLHQALRGFLGKHVEQKGSLVHPDYLRFDFSHFQKLTDEEIAKVEAFVNDRIRENLELNENRYMPYDQAIKSGAMALFGEKYGDAVRVIQFGTSVELCGGTHVKATGQISYFKIVSESAIAAGIRRIEAITGKGFDNYFSHQISTVDKVKEILKNPQDILKAVETLVADNAHLQKKIDAFEKEQLVSVKANLLKKAVLKGNISIISEIIEISTSTLLKDLAFQLKSEMPRLVCVLGATIDRKANLAVMVTDELVKEKGLNAGVIVRELAKEIDGGGGGQAFLATAGGKKPEGLKNAIEKGKNIV